MSTEYLLRAQLEDERERDLRHEIPPGRIVRTTGLAPERVIYRVARPGEGDGRDDNGVARGADRAVDRAASSSGQPLPDDVRARFEGSLGADLSAVRVHTGDASAAAANAVGALAYTTGTDIHFAAGRYAPSDPFGLHLLAHEVAHTVQHHAGAAVSRNPGDPPAGGGDKQPLGDLLEVSSFTLTKPGAVAATPAGDNVNVKSPPVDLSSDVKVKDSVKAEDKDKLTKILIGSIQNSTSSSRIGVYKKGDQVVAEHNVVTSGAAADAQTSTSDPTKRNAASVVPFYQAPDYIDKDKWTGTALMHDQPELMMPKQLAGGVLTETKGSDEFITAVAAKRDDEILQLKQETWSVPWALPIDASMTGTGGKVDANPTTDKAAITDDSPIAAAKAEEWDVPKTVEAAKAMAPGQLLAALVSCRSKDQDAYKNCVQAVTELNWHYTIKVTCANSFSLAGSERVSVTAKGASGSQNMVADLNTGGSLDVSFNFLTVFLPESWQSGSKITISVSVTNNLVSGDKSFTDSWAAPFDSVADAVVPGSDNHYKITKTRA